MPAYDPASTSKPTMSPLGVDLWVADPTLHVSPTLPSSKQFSLHRDPNFPSCFSVQVEFSGAPGTFHLDVETADIDQAKYYIAKGSISAVNSSNIGRIELTNVVAKFARLTMVTLTNDVSVTAKVF